MFDSPRRRLTAKPIAAALAAGVLVSACTVGSADSNASVTGTDDTCEIATPEVQAGTIDFEFTNTGTDVSELYVLRANGDVVGEVENVTTGTKRTLTVDLAAGDYRIRCKPGQSGDGIDAAFIVTGAGGAAQAAAESTITFTSREFRYEQLDLTGITAGSTIRFEMTNTGSQAHEFEVLLPNGDALGEVASMEPGASGGATLTLVEPGVYTYQCILVDPGTGKQHTDLGMIGTFDVEAA